MNNSKFALESLEEEEKVDRSADFKEREAKVVRILEAIRVIRSSVEWSSLKTEVFDGLTARLEKDLREEAKKDQPDPCKLNRIAGQLKWAEKFSDLSKLENVYMVELQGIRLQSKLPVN